MNQVELIFYLDKFKEHHNQPLYEYVLDVAHDIGIEYALIFKAVAGIAENGPILEESFFEAGSNVPIEIKVITNEDAAKKLISKLKEEQVQVTYTKQTIDVYQLTKNN